MLSAAASVDGELFASSSDDTIVTGDAESTPLRAMRDPVTVISSSVRSVSGSAATASGARRCRSPDPGPRGAARIRRERGDAKRVGSERGDTEGEGAVVWTADSSTVVWADVGIDTNDVVHSRSAPAEYPGFI